jgi:hypothetical protein
LYTLPERNAPLLSSDSWAGLVVDVAYLDRADPSDVASYRRPTLNRPLLFLLTCVCKLAENETNITKSKASIDYKDNAVKYEIE